LIGKENLSGAKGGVFALGNFDGVHRGHRRVLDAAIAKARAMGEPARVLTFEPNPRSVFYPDLPPFRLTPAAAKERLLRAYGMDDVVALPFTTEFAQVTAQEFIERVLLEQFGVRHIVVGHDFIFGHKRGGNIQNMTAWLAPHGVGVTEVLAFGDVCGAFSSTRVREALQQGEVAGAAKILGRDWSIAGTVVKGAQRGRMIGVPTANIALRDYLRPKFGVYAVRARRVGEAAWVRGVANIGVRPTVDGVSETLEAHVFDFDQDIYGQEWEFALTRFIRAERKFDGLDALKAQIMRDIDAAKA
jgi:riboflavin kinase/FMN adenylyltransferase